MPWHVRHTANLGNKALQEELAYINTNNRSPELRKLLRILEMSSEDKQTKLAS